MESTVSLIVQPDGKILGPQARDTVNGQTRHRLIRFNSDGTWDRDFAFPEISGGLMDMALQTDGRILVGGYFEHLGGQMRRTLGRLNSDGTLDTTFNPKVTDVVLRVTLQPDGKIILTGVLYTLGTSVRHGIGRLNNTEPAMQFLSFKESNIIWFRSGAGPEIWRSTFDSSTNGKDWKFLGPGERIAGGWQLTNVHLQPKSFVRARGYVNDGSSWFVESMQSTSPLFIVTEDGELGLQSDGFQFDFGGSPGRAIVEVSSDLLQWTARSTNELPNGRARFVDRDAQSQARRYYRLRRED